MIFLVYPVSWGTDNDGDFTAWAFLVIGWPWCACHTGHEAIGQLGHYVETWAFGNEYWGKWGHPRYVILQYSVLSPGLPWFQRLSWRFRTQPQTGPPHPALRRAWYQHHQPAESCGEKCLRLRLVNTGISGCKNICGVEPYQQMWNGFYPYVPIPT